jgi:hypothetical protein
MAFTISEIDMIKKEMDAFILKRRPPENVRNQVDLSYKIDKQSIPAFNDEVRQKPLQVF